jgi:hypothetical protein
MWACRRGMPSGWRVVGKGFYQIKPGGTNTGRKASRKQTNLFAALEEKMP